MWAFLETFGTALSEFVSLAFYGPVDPDAQTAHFGFRQWFFLILAVAAVLGLGSFLYIRFGFHL
jgi:hypothetical protein